VIKPVGASTIAEYFDQIEEPRKSEVKAIHSMIRKVAPELKPKIVSGMIGYGSYHYKYASGREGDWPVIALASQKNYISVYVCAAESGKYLAEQRKNELGKVSVGKSCIRFRRTEDVNLAVLEQLVRAGSRFSG
jgi:hypothetical protein